MLASRTIRSGYAASSRAVYSTAASAATHSSKVANILRSQRNAQSEQPPPTPPTDPALALFNDVVNSSSASERTPQFIEPSEWSLAGSIKALMANTEMSSRDKMHRFEEHVWPHVTAFKGVVPNHLQTTVLRFLYQESKKMLSDGDSSCSTTIADMFTKLGRSEHGVRRDIVLNLCHKLMEENRDASPEEKRAGVSELVGLWKEISHIARRVTDIRKNEFMLPSREEMASLMKHRKRLNESRTLPFKFRPFSAIFPQHTPNSANSFVPALLATVSILSDPSITPPEMLKEAAPLLDAVAFAMKLGKPSPQDIDGVFQLKGSSLSDSSKAGLRDLVFKQWDKLSSLLLDQSLWKDGLAKPAPSKEPSRFKRQLRAAYAAGNTGAAISVWKKATAGVRGNSQLSEVLRDDWADFLDYAVFLWCALRRHEYLDDALDIMADLALPRTLKTYTAMMHGWKQCKDSKRIETLWSKLVEAGMRMDSHIWTERISALIETGQLQAGVQALADMMQTWKNAHGKDEKTTAVRPTIEVVNAILKPLLAIDPQAANEVLAWAGREGLDPDVRTYNIMLGESLKAGNPKSAQAILQAMQNDGIFPDEATFTIILEEVLGGLHEASAAEQVEAVRQTLTDIESAGLRPNPETYGKMLHAVASLGHGSDAAIDAVQEHMIDKGFRVTPHMVTILLERKVSQGASGDAITELLQRHGLHSIDKGDHKLWERVTGAYASARQLDDAMRVYRDLQLAGRPVTSLLVLQDLVEALVAEDRLDEGREVVSAVLRHRLKVAETGKEVERFWRHYFWHLAHRHGLLRQDEAPPELWARVNPNGW